ncbi:RNase3 domain-containing protein [Xylariales sp. AK1849]|nr:RNase3 domain-containing protein [Xylariales sp. AK1849]
MTPLHDEDSSTEFSGTEGVDGTPRSLYAASQASKHSDDSLVEEIDGPPSPALAGDRETHDESVIHARAYQEEMYEESLKHNIIVAMDTGSGKTQVAVLRIQYELGHSQPGKIIWFLTPTVALCDQQFKVLKMRIQGVLIKMLSGNDGVDTWSTLSIWDSFLENVQIVVSTYQVLLDALSHGFVRMDALSLIVFDEAHNCVGKNPGSKIMSLYKESKQAGLHVPAILGLTASPVMKSSINALEVIEEILDAVCRTPMKHRAELLSYVKRPVLRSVPYGPRLKPNDRGLYTKTMKSLKDAYHGLDIIQDPYILRRKSENTERSRDELIKAIKKHDTPVIKQMESLRRKTAEICCELGTWAADYFVCTAITQYLESLSRSDMWYAAWDLAEKQFLAAALRKVELPQECPFDDIQISDKVSKLLEILISCQENTLGIIFVKETASVYILRQLLSIHPLTCNRFRVGSMVGSSRYAGRKRDLGELNRDDGSLNLENFRSGKLNFLIATTVLEEGIDVPACNLVICFDEPANLKSFIQRRGRARMRDSNLVLLYDTASDKHTEWHILEEDMKRKYEDERRERTVIDELEESEEAYIAPFYTHKTRAKLEFDAAKPHLEHFCSVLASRQYVEWRPYYITRKMHYTKIKSEPPQIKATVVLPNSLPPELRRINSENAWYSEKNACKDAAFQAYVKLYDAGLVNEHLMPLKDEELGEGVETREPIVEINERWNPWPRVAKAWSGAQVHRCPLILLEGDQTLCDFEVTLPVPIPEMPTFDIFWSSSPWKVKLGPISEGNATGGRDADETMALITLAHGYRLTVKDGGKHVVHFHSKGGKISIEDLGSRPFTSELKTHFDDKALCLIRRTFDNAPFIYEKWLPSRPSLDLVQKPSNYEERYLQEHAANDGPWLALRKWSRRRDYLHPIVNSPKPAERSSKHYSAVWPVSCCRVDSTPITNVQFGSLIPAITHMIEIYLVAQELSGTILAELHFRDLSKVLTAISASSADEVTDYQRYEFLGDSILKLLATVSVTVNYPHFPEGYLHTKRTRIVSNSRLCRSSKEAGLDRFIIDKKFTGAKWQPLYVDELLLPKAPEKRSMSTKILADVVESLIGASYEDGKEESGKTGGMEKALKCLKLLVSDIQWYGLEAGRLALSSLKPSATELPDMLQPLEQLIGYSFTNKSLLLEAVTHASYNLGTSADMSLERLEFLGDAILDSIVVTKLWEHEPALPHRIMTLLRAACVNADLLGFLGMEWAVAQETSDIVDGIAVKSHVTFPFWKFMRHSSPEIGVVQRGTEQRHALERELILSAMQDSPTYPWALLAHLSIPKFFSDIFESVLGAVWVDSGSMDLCEQLVERIGILPCLRRMLADSVDVAHPKNKLGEMAGRKKVKYEVSREEAATAWFRCKVFMGEELVVEVGEGVHRDEIITKAAEAACDIMREREDAGEELDKMSF